MFNNRETIIPDFTWHEAEANHFYMRTADDHARVQLAIGGPAAGKWRAVLNDAGLYSNKALLISWFETEDRAKEVGVNQLTYIITKRVDNARKVMTFYTQPRKEPIHD